MSVLSIRLNEGNQNFLERLAASGKKTNKGKIINRALDIYRKILLKKELMDFAENNKEEDVFLADLDLESYIDLIEKES